MVRGCLICVLDCLPIFVATSRHAVLRGRMVAETRVCGWVLLCCLIGGQSNVLPDTVSDRLGGFGERRGYSEWPGGLDGEFVVAAA